MGMITADEVIRRIETFYEGGALNYLSSPEAEAGRLAVERTADNIYLDGDAGRAIR